MRQCLVPANDNDVAVLIRSTLVLLLTAESGNGIFKRAVGNTDGDRVLLNTASVSKRLRFVECARTEHTLGAGAAITAAAKAATTAVMVNFILMVGIGELVRF